MSGVIDKLRELRNKQLGMDDLDVKEYHDALDDAIKRLEVLDSVTAVATEWRDKEGHDSCWYYPELFAKFLTTLGLDPKPAHSLPRAEFEVGCRRYADELYGKGPDGDLREKFAALVHDQWSGWMKYLFGLCQGTKWLAGPQVAIPEAAEERWRRQMSTPYGQLPEEEKKSDRELAGKFIELIESYATRFRIRGEEKLPQIQQDLISWTDASFFCGYYRKRNQDQARLLIELTEENTKLRGRLDGTIKPSVFVQDAMSMARDIETCPGDDGFSEYPVCNKCGMKASWHKSTAYLEKLLTLLKQDLKESL